MFSFTNGASEDKNKKDGSGAFMDSVFCYGLSIVLLQKANTQIDN